MALRSSLRKSDLDDLEAATADADRVSGICCWRINPDVIVLYCVVNSRCWMVVESYSESSCHTGIL
jgi:hypothetical protein